MNDPVASEAAETAVLLAAKGTGRGIIDAVIIHVGHPGLYPERKPNTALPIPREDAAREAVLGIVGDPQDFCAPTTLMIGAWVRTSPPGTLACRS